MNHRHSRAPRGLYYGFKRYTVPAENDPAHRLCSACCSVLAFRVIVLYIRGKRIRTIKMCARGLGTPHPPPPAAAVALVSSSFVRLYGFIHLFRHRRSGENTRCTHSSFLFAFERRTQEHVRRAVARCRGKTLVVKNTPRGSHCSDASRGALGARGPTV